MSRETPPPPTAEAPEITIPEQRSLLEVQTGAGVSPAQQPPDGGGEGAVGGSAAEILEDVESRWKAQAFEKALAKRLKGIGGTDEEIQDQYTKAVKAAHMDVEASLVWEKAYAGEAVRLRAAGFISSSQDLFHEAAKTAADKAVQEYWNRRTWFGEPPKTGAASDKSPSYRMALLDSFGRGAQSARDEIKRLRAGSNNPAQPSDPTEQATDPDSLSTPSDPDETSNPGKSNEPSSGNSDTTTTSSGEVVAGNDDSNDNSSRSQVASQAPSSEAKNSGESRESDEAPKGRLGKVFAAAKQALGRIRRTAYLAPQNTRYKVESFMTPDREKAELKRNVVAAVLGAVAAGFALKFGESAYDAIFGSAEAVVGGADPSLGGDGVNYINEAESLAEAAQDNAKSNQASEQNSAPIEVQEVSIGDNKYVWGYFEQEVGAENATSEILRRVELLEQNGWDVEFWGDPTKGDTWGIERMTDPNGKTYDGTGRQVSALMHADYYDSAKEIANPIGSGGSTEKLPLNENTSSGNSEVDLSDGNGNSDLGAQEVASQSPQEVKESEHKSLVTDGADSTIIRPDDQLTVINSANSTESGGTAGEAHLAIRERFEQAANAEHEPGFFDGIKDGMTKAGMAAATLGGIALLAVGGLTYASRDKDGAAEGANLGGLFTPPEGEDPKTKNTGRKKPKKAGRK